MPVSLPTPNSRPNWLRARQVSHRFNHADPAAAALILRELLGGLGSGAWVDPPFHCDHGSQIHIGDGVIVNMGCTCLDRAPTRIGDQAQLGPGVQRLTATHPLDAGTHIAGPELARPIAIGAHAWLGGAVVVFPGVSIEAETVVGEG